MRARRALAPVPGLLLLVGSSSGAVAADGRTRVADGARTMGRGIEEAAREVGHAVSSAAKETGRRLDRAGRRARPVFIDRVHDRARDFGHALWDGIKHAARTAHAFFAGGPPPPRRGAG